MSRKRWASEEEAREFAVKAFHEGKTGLSFWAACDYIGWTPERVHKLKLFFELLYGDFLICAGAYENILDVILLFHIKINLTVDTAVSHVIDNKSEWRNI